MTISSLIHSVLSDATVVIFIAVDSKQFYLFFKGKNTIQDQTWLDKYCSDSAPLKQIVEKWFAGFARDPKEVVIPENKENSIKSFWQKVKL